MIDINKGNSFHESFEQFDVPGPFQFSNLLQLPNNQLYQDSSVAFFWKLNKEQLTVLIVNYW